MSVCPSGRGQSGNGAAFAQQTDAPKMSRAEVRQMWPGQPGCCRSWHCLSMPELLRDRGGHSGTAPPHGWRTLRRELLNPVSVYVQRHNRKRMQRACFLEGKLQLGSCTSSCPAPSWSLASPWPRDKVAACPVPSYPPLPVCPWAQPAPACPACSHHTLDTLGLAWAEVPWLSTPSPPCGCSPARVSISFQVGAV